MDIQMAHQLIWEYLNHNDSYSSIDSYKMLDWKSLQDDKLDDKECKAAIDIAFQDLIDAKMVKKTELSSGKTKETVYVINESLKNAPVSLVVSRQCAEQIATVVNSVIPFFTLEKVEPIEAKDICEDNLLLLIETVVLMKDKIEKSLDEIDRLKKTPPKSDQEN